MLRLKSCLLFMLKHSQCYYLGDLLSASHQDKWCASENRMHQLLDVGTLQFDGGMYFQSPQMILWIFFVSLGNIFIL